MAYDLHVVRTEDWADAASAPITKPEVEALIATDPELAWSATDFVDMADASGTVTRYWMITWQGQSCFWWYRDQIQCSDPPSDAHISKLIQIAQALHAQVIGDDGEIYPLVPLAAPGTSPPPPPSGATPTRWPLWKQLLVAFLLGCVLLGLKLLIFGG
ncbi:MAG TPA: hypothetical protein VL527_17985 [Dongiaceae bacterium]|jgi:hypothetical protein|nr:hypothetical protein [Dongiaceae bacterium]